MNGCSLTASINSKIKNTFLKNNTQGKVTVFQGQKHKSGTKSVVKENEQTIHFLYLALIKKQFVALKLKKFCTITKNA